jgi:hypothetical protein
MSLAKQIAQLRIEIAKEAEMRFSLKYQGELLAAKRKDNRSQNKNQLRWHFSEQLEQLLKRGDFSRIPKFESVSKTGKGIRIDFSKVPEWKHFNDAEYLAIVDRSMNVGVTLDIEIERHEPPGSLFQHGGDHSGDLDNRLKTLFDGLRSPHDASEAISYSKSFPARENLDKEKERCVCLLEDDGVITGFRVSTSASLDPNLPQTHVAIKIGVEIKAHDYRFDSES